MQGVPRLLREVTARRICLSVGLAFLVANGIRNALFVGHPSPVGDGIGYAELSKVSPLAPEFWVAFRPPFYPLLLMGLGDYIYLFQHALYLLSTAALVFGIYRNSRSTAVFAFCAAIVLLITASPHYIIWNGYVLTESLTFSGCILLMACGLFAREYPVFCWSSIFLILAVMTLTRDVMLYLSIAFLGIVTAGASTFLLFRREKPASQDRSPSRAMYRSAPVAIGVAVLLGSIATASYSQRSSVRYLPNLINIMQMRLLGDAQAMDFLVRHQMPTGPVVAGRKYKAAWDDIPEWTSDDMRAFAEWLRHPGLAVYEEFLITHPSRTLSYLFDDRIGLKTAKPPLILEDIGIPSVLNLHVADGIYPHVADVSNRFKPSLFTKVTSLPITFTGYVLTLAAALASFCLAWWRRSIDAIAGLVLATFAGLAASELADSWDIWRHGLPFILIAQLGLIIFISRLAESAIARNSQP